MNHFKISGVDNRGDPGDMRARTRMCMKIVLGYTWSLTIPDLHDALDWICVMLIRSRYTWSICVDMCDALKSHLIYSIMRSQKLVTREAMRNGRSGCARCAGSLYPWKRCCAWSFTHIISATFIAIIRANSSGPLLYLSYQRTRLHFSLLFQCEICVELHHSGVPLDWIQTSPAIPNNVACRTFVLKRACTSPNMFSWSLHSNALDLLYNIPIIVERYYRSANRSPQLLLLYFIRNRLFQQGFNPISIGDTPHVEGLLKVVWDRIPAATTASK